MRFAAHSIALLFLAILTACSPPSPPPAAFVVTQLVTSAPTRLVVETQAPSPSPIPSPTPVPRSTITPVPTFNLLTLPSPMPTAQLSQAELFQRLDFFAPVAGCELPCFRGITPGITSLAGAQAFYAQMGLETTWEDIQDALRDPERSMMFKHVAQFPYSEQLHKLELTDMPTFAPSLALVSDGYHITRLELYGLYHPEMGKLERMIERYGLPEEIRAWPRSNGNLSLVFHYQRFRTFISIHSAVHIEAEDTRPVMKCRSPVPEMLNTDLDIYSPQDEDWVVGLYRQNTLPISGMDIPVEIAMEFILNLPDCQSGTILP